MRNRITEVLWRYLRPIHLSPQPHNFFRVCCYYTVLENIETATWRESFCSSVYLSPWALRSHLPGTGCLRSCCFSSCNNIHFMYGIWDRLFLVTSTTLDAMGCTGRCGTDKESKTQKSPLGARTKRQTNLKKKNVIYLYIVYERFV